MSRIFFNKFIEDRRLTISIIIAIAIIVILVLIIVKPKLPANNNVAENESSMLSSSIIVEDDGYYGEYNNIEVDISIPHFKNLSDSYSFYINDLIKNRYDYKKVYEEFVAGMKNADKLKFKYLVDYERYNYYDFISILINEYAELEGDRPRKTKAYYVINAKESRTATLDDLFLGTQKYEEKIIEEVNTQAMNKGIEFANQKGITNISQIQSFYIKDGKLHIFFEASSVAANSYGDLDFEMPFESKNGIFIF